MVRLLLAALFVSGWLGALSSQASTVAAPSGTAVPAEEQLDACSAELTVFREALVALRKGEGTGDELRRSGERLCRDHGRCDARDVARHYLSLTQAELAQGLDDERRFVRLRRRVQTAAREGLRGPAWAEVRDELLGDLAQFRREVEARPDFVPAARALALSARLLAERIDTDSSISAAERTSVLARSGEEAQESLELFGRAGQVTPSLEPHWLLGRLAQLDGDTAGARIHFEDCERAARQVGSEDFREHALLGLIDLARDAGESARVDWLLSELATFRAPGQSWALTREYTVRLLNEDRADGALEFLAKHVPGEPRWHREWSLLTGSAHLRLGEFAEAGAHFADLGDAGGGEWSALATAELALRRGEYQAVVDELDDASVVRSVEGTARATSILGEAQLRLGRPGAAAATLERALQLTRLWQRTRGSSRPSQNSRGSVIGEWLGLDTVVLLAEAEAQNGDALVAALTIENGQSRYLRETQGRVELTQEELGAWAANYEHGLVTFAVGSECTLGVHVTREGLAVSRVFPLGRAAIQRAVRRMREALISGDGIRSEQLAHELEDALFPDDWLRIEGARDGRLLFSLHGPLERLPLAALSFEDKLTPVILPGLPAVHVGREINSAALDWTLVGHPLTRAGTPLLPGARVELNQLIELYPNASSHVGPEFTRANFLQALEGSGALHVATHLESQSVCESLSFSASGLELSGGEVVCAREILERSPALELVVLSACETGDGRFLEAEGLHGVARAFLEGGTRNLLVTLWPVSDEAARELALAFHRALRAGMLPSRAAAAARAELREAGQPAAAWAAFRLLGRD